MQSASCSGDSGCSSSGGLRQKSGAELPAMKGQFSARARSYIHRASVQLYARCLSVKIGTARPDLAMTPQT